MIYDKLDVLLKVIGIPHKYTPIPFYKDKKMVCV
jgi:hypothetical protein